MTDWITNKGWEEGVYGGWVHTGDGAIGTVSNLEPRTDTYSLRFTTGSSSIRWGRVKFTITDSSTLAYLAGKDITFTVYSHRELVFSASDDNNIRRIECGDNISEDTTTIPKTPYLTWEQQSVVHTVTASPTEIYFAIYWYKGGSRAIYRVYIDDMNVTVGDDEFESITFYPSDGVARPTTIRHIFKPGSFRMLVGIGDIGLDVDIAESRTESEYDELIRMIKEAAAMQGPVSGPIPPVPNPLDPVYGQDDFFPTGFEPSTGALF